MAAKGTPSPQHSSQEAGELRGHPGSIGVGASLLCVGGAAGRARAGLCGSAQRRQSLGAPPPQPRSLCEPALCPLSRGGSESSLKMLVSFPRS